MNRKIDTKKLSVGMTVKNYKDALGAAGLQH